MGSFFFPSSSHSWFRLKSQWEKEKSDLTHSGFSSDQEHFLSSEELFPVICWAESSWKRLKLVSSVSKRPVQPLSSCDCRTSLGKGAWLLHGGANWWHGWVWSEAEKVFFRVEKRMLYVNLFLNGCFQLKETSCAHSVNNAEGQEQQPKNEGTNNRWKPEGNTLSLVKSDRSVFAELCFSHQAPPLSCGKSSKACREVRTEITLL